MFEGLAHAKHFILNLNKELNSEGEAQANNKFLFI